MSEPMRFVPIPGLGIEMSVTPVTQGQWLEVMSRNPSVNGGFGRENHPVENVSAEHAEEFCFLLCERDGGRYRLPTSAEWEYAAKGGTDSVVYGLGGDIGWFSPISGEETCAVGLLAPNAYGLHDTLGNVWEMTASTFHGWRTMRGGCAGATFAECQTLGWDMEDLETGADGWVGFRIVRETE